MNITKQILISVIIIIIFIITFSYLKTPECYESKAILHNQRVGKLNGCCDNCLIFNVTEFVCCGNPGDECGCEWKDKMLYFSGEQEERKDLKNKSEIWINWCWQKELNDYRIRGVRVANKTQ